MVYKQRLFLAVMLATSVLTAPIHTRLLQQSSSAEELIPNDAQLQGFNNFEGQKMLESTGSDDQALESGADATAANDAQALFGGGRYQGDGTAYSESVPNSGANFACSYRYLNDWASTHFAAINIHQWDNGNACGRCVTARCVDPRCATQNKDVTVMIVDQCPECAHGDVDFSIPVYRDITGMWPHRLRVEWEWSDCSPYINGTIKMSPKDGSNPYWRAFYFSNFKYPLKTAYLNGQEMPRSQFQFFQHSGSLQSSNTFELEAVNGERVSITVKDPMMEQDLGVQFA